MERNFSYKTEFFYETTEFLYETILSCKVLWTGRDLFPRVRNVHIPPTVRKFIRLLMTHSELNKTTAVFLAYPVHCMFNDLELKNKEMTIKDALNIRQIITYMWYCRSVDEFTQFPFHMRSTYTVVYYTGFVNIQVYVFPMTSLFLFGSHYIETTVVEITPTVVTLFYNIYNTRQRRCKHVL